MAPRPQDLRVVGLCGLAFLLMLTYAIARPATESLFIQAHTSRGLPAAWLFTTVAMLAVVSIYNQFVGRFDLARLFAAVTLVSAGALVALLGAHGAGLWGVYYLLYAWKEIFIVVLVEIYYSYTNSVFPIRTARWFYGLFGAMGALGGIVGNLLVGFLAQRMGTLGALCAVPLLLVAIWFAVRSLQSRAGAPPPRGSSPSRFALTAAADVVSRSNYLGLVLLLIVAVQVTITLVDFQFNQVVEAAYPLTDRRTAIIGQIYAAVNVATLVLNGLTGPTLRAMGVPATLLAIPALLGAVLGVFVLRPGLWAVAALKIGSKSFDYTLFRAAKEILYIPLSYAERTAGKSIVDMLTYRVAKGGASLLLLGLIALHAEAWVSHLTFGIIAVWLVTTVVVARRFRSLVSRERELRPIGDEKTE